LVRICIRYKIENRLSLMQFHVSRCLAIIDYLKQKRIQLNYKNTHCVLMGMVY
jgi:hypothetical protein